MKIAAGILMYKIENNKLSVFLVHPGGPIYSKKDIGYWSIPKGEVDEGETDMLETAKREFEEETGIKAEGDKFIDLGTIIQKNNKKVYCWSYESDIPANYTHKSNTFTMEWPPKSGKFQEFPETDKAEFFSYDKAKEYMRPDQFEMVERLKKVVNL